jgi:hypothetical protein
MIDLTDVKAQILTSVANRLVVQQRNEYGTDITVAFLREKQPGRREELHIDIELVRNAKRKTTLKATLTADHNVADLIALACKQVRQAGGAFEPPTTLEAIAERHLTAQPATQAPGVTQVLFARWCIDPHSRTHVAITPSAVAAVEYYGGAFTTPVGEEYPAASRIILKGGKQEYLVQGSVQQIMVALGEARLGRGK